MFGYRPVTTRPISATCASSPGMARASTMDAADEPVAYARPAQGIYQQPYNLPILPCLPAALQHAHSAMPASSPATCRLCHSCQLAARGAWGTRLRDGRRRRDGRVRQAELVRVEEQRQVPPGACARTQTITARPRLAGSLLQPPSTIHRAVCRCCSRCLRQTTNYCSIPGWPVNRTHGLQAVRTYQPHLTSLHTEPALVVAPWLLMAASAAAGLKC